MKSFFFIQRGFALLDALIAMVIIAIGVLGIAKLNSILLASTGIAKTRAEATQLAEGKIEEFRGLQPPAAKPVTNTTGELISGVNAQFTITWIVESAGVTNTNLDKVDVCVSWGDACGGTGEKKVELSSLLAWTDLATFAAIGSGQVLPVEGIPGTPTGSAQEVSDSSYALDSMTAGMVDNLIDGTSIAHYDGNTVLIETSTGKVLLLIHDGSSFSTISGNVYISWGSGVNNRKGSDISLSDINSYVHVLGSTGSVCRQYNPGGLTSLPTYPASGDIEYSYFSYSCYMGANWWGNIAIVRLDGGDRVCIGDPIISQADTDPTSRRPFLSSIRYYRGYKCGTDNDPATCQSVGIGMSSGSYIQAHYGKPLTALQHHFLLTTIGGNPTHADCAVMQSRPTADANPFTNMIFHQGGNTGQLFCLTATCPIASGFVEYKTSFVMIVPVSQAALVEITSVVVDGGSCAAPTITDSQLIYHCTIDWKGWAGYFWSGNVTFTMSGSIEGVELDTAQPSGSIVGAPVIGCEGNKCIQFSSVPKEVTSFSVSLAMTPSAATF